MSNKVQTCKLIMEGNKICQTAEKYPNQMKQSYHVPNVDKFS